MATDFSRAVWRKSSYSGHEGCVEIATVDGTVGIRDTKDSTGGPILVFNADEWKAFLLGVQAGEFPV
jgi:Domain of unknown function (DUF397)